MKKWIALVMACCLAFSAAAALAEEEATVPYIDRVPEAMVYESVWVAEDGEWRIEAFAEDDGFRMLVVHRLGDNMEEGWEYSAALGEDNAMTAVPMGLHYREDVVEGTSETLYEDGDAVFTLNGDGKLLWNDKKEDAGKGLEFQKIGTFYGTTWLKGDIEVEFYDWYDGQYDIRAYRKGADGEVLEDAIFKGDYDADADAITAEGFFDPDKPITVIFSHDEEGNVVWTENEESTVLEYCFENAEG